MLSVALVTPHYAELGTPAGLCTAALAHAFVHAGIAVHVVCAMSPAPRPRHETRGLLTIHRLEIRRGSPPQAFSLGACGRVHELIEANRCDVIECVDAPWCLISLASQMGLRGRRQPLVSVIVDPRGAEPAHAQTAIRLADARISTHETTYADRVHIPFPLVDALWSPPRDPGAMLIVSDAPDQQTTGRIMHAYTQSRARREGWSLAVRAHDGRWSVTGSEHADLSDPRRVLISAGNASPVAQLHALGHGSMSIISCRSPLALANRDWPLSFDPEIDGSLVQAMNRTVDTPLNELRVLARAWSDRLCPAHDAAGVTAAHQRLWAQAPSASPAPTRAWRSLEHHLTLTGEGAHA